MEVSFSQDHAEPKNAQLLVALTGSPKAIQEKLLSLAKEIDSAYGKPCRGQEISFNLASHVITPVWEGRVY
jgi:hypothetical protein